MSPQLTAIPRELILRIVELLFELEGEQSVDSEDSRCTVTLNLARTCTRFYEILRPYLFQSITIRNTEKSGRAVKYLRGTAHVANVRTLHFKGEAPGNRKDHFKDVEGVFPATVNDILGNLSQFPHLTTLIISFNFHMHMAEQHSHWHGYRSSESEETVEQMQDAEEHEGYRGSGEEDF